MAVSIDRVYQRVLFLANKDQRGYITPDEFNSFAHQAQLEIFESYFLKKFQTNQAPMTSDDYSDVAMNVDEKIEVFTNMQNVARTTIGAMGSVVNGYAYPDNFYRLAHVSIMGPQGFPVMADEISHRDAHYVNLSPLTRPTVTQPVFSRYEGGVIVFPDTELMETVMMTYVRIPTTPVWAYSMDTPTGTPMFVPSGSTVPGQVGTTQDFELHPSDEQELVYKILTMAGVTIKQPDVSGFGQGKDQQIASTEG